MKQSVCIKNKQPKIKIIGVGGGGCNIVNYIYNNYKDEVAVALCDMDKKSLEKSGSPITLQLGKTGLGGGNNSYNSREIAEKEIVGIKELIGGEFQIIVVVACLGGGCGSGVAPLIIRELKKLGFIAISVVTIPFEFEGKQKLERSADAVKEMTERSDAVFVLNNQFILEQNKDMNVFDGFSRADKMMYEAIKGIIKILLEPNIEMSKKAKAKEIKGIKLLRNWFKSQFRKKEKDET